MRSHVGVRRLVVRRLAAPGALLVAGICALGCAIPTQSDPVSIAPSKVPFGLLNRHPPTTTTTLPKPSALVPVKVFFLNSNAGNQLTPANRVVSAPAPLTAILSALLAGPSSAEQGIGITTAIPNDVNVLSATTSAPNVVTVNFSSGFGQIIGSATEEAVAQVVTTVATENGATTGVIFEIEGQRISVPLANGSQVPGPVYVTQLQGP
jgi:spore germination protein GerM